MPNCRVLAGQPEGGRPSRSGEERPSLEAGQDQASILCGVQICRLQGVQGLAGGEAHSNGLSRDGWGIRTMCPGAKRRWA